MNIHKSQLFWCEQKGYKVLTHCHFMPWKSMKVATCSPRFLCLLHLPCFTKPSLARSYVAMPGNALKCVQSHASQPGSGPSFSQQRWSADPFFRPLQGGYAWEDGINIFIPTTLYMGYLSGYFFAINLTNWTIFPISFPSTSWYQFLAA
jgi:hypothetical protein